MKITPSSRLQRAALPVKMCVRLHTYDTQLVGARVQQFVVCSRALHPLAGGLKALGLIFISVNAMENSFPFQVVQITPWCLTSMP